MKTQYELQYEELIIEMISSDNSSAYSQLDLFIDFHQNSRNYYDMLCDALYLLSSGQTTDTLWITPSGKPYLSDATQSSYDKALFTAEQVPVFVDDLPEQLAFTFTFLRTYLFSSRSSLTMYSHCDTISVQKN